MIENKCYIAKNKIECYNKYIAMLDETPTLCDHFSTIVNETLTKTDYEVIYIFLKKCNFIFI